MIMGRESLPEMDYYTGGLDFGMNMAAVKIGHSGKSVYLVAGHGAGQRDGARSFDKKDPVADWYRDGFSYSCGPACGERIQENHGGVW